MRPMQRAPELRPIVERCLAKHPKDRFSSIAQLATALAAFSSSETSRDYVARIHRLLGFTPGEIVEAPRVPAVTPPAPVEIVREAVTVDTWTAPKRSWMPIAVLSGIAAAIVIVVVVALNRSGTPAEPPVEPPPQPVEIKVEAKPEPAPAQPPKAEPVRPEPVVEKPPKKPVQTKKPPPTIAPVVIKPPPTNPKDASRCPDGSLVSSHWKGCPKK
jgi:hypothetical protein